VIRPTGRGEVLSLVAGLGRRVAQVLILLTLSTQWVPRPSRFLRRAGTTNVCSGAELGHSMAERNLRPALVHAHRPPIRPKDRNDNCSTAHADHVGYAKPGVVVRRALAVA
jgi:hypothetical protein